MILPLLLAFSAFPQFSTATIDSSRFSNYSPLQSQGQIPETFLLSSTEKYRKAKKKISGDDQRDIQRQKDAFYQRSNYLLNEILFSGEVLFNDPVGHYVNEVANVVLQELPALQDELDFYIIKSPIANAFATNNGVILISLGLIAQLQNEAQLAFVLAHEITHYRNNDVIEQFLENQKIEAGKRNYGNLTYGRINWAKKKYSRKIEMRADQQALEIYKKTDYDPAILPSVIDVLHYSYLPFQDIPFAKDFFETDYLKFPDEYFLDQTKSIQTDKEDYNAKNSTHPNTHQRKQQINNFLQKTDVEGGVQFQVSQEEFKHIRQLARFELSRLYYLNRNYGKAIYNSYLLLQQRPDNQYLQENIAKSFYNLTMYSNASELHEVLESYQKTEGEMQQLIFFLDELRDEELHGTALIYAWKARQKFPGNKDIRLIADKLLKEYVWEYKDDINDFSTISRKAASQKIDKDPADTTTNKYQKINTLKQEDVTEVRPGNIIKYAFVDLLDDSTFIKTFEHYASEKLGSQRRILTLQDVKDIHKQERKRANKIKREGHSLGIDTLVVVDPSYTRLDQRKNTAIQIFDSEKKERQFQKNIRKIAGSHGLHVTFLSANQLTPDAVRQYNQLSYLNEWLQERLSHSADGVLPQFIDHKARALINDLGTRYVSWTGTFAITSKDQGKGFHILFGALLPPLLPYSVYKLSAADNFTYYFNFVFDLKRGTPELVVSETIDQKDRTAIIKSHLYFTFQQIHSER